MKREQAIAELPVILAVWNVAFGRVFSVLGGPVKVQLDSGQSP